MTVICMFFHCYCISNSLFMGILYKRYFGRLILLRSFGYGREYGRLHVSRAVLCAPISGACIRICQICLLLSEVEVCFFLF